MFDTKRLRQVSSLDKECTKEASLIKAMEEFGELSAAFLNSNEYPNKSKSSLPNVLEEGVDTIMCLFDLLYKSGYSDENISNILEVKLNKWENKLLN